MSWIPRWVDATNTSPKTALEEGVRISKVLGQEVGVIIKDTAITSTDIVTWWCIVTDLWITYPYKK